MQEEKLNRLARMRRMDTHRQYEQILGTKKAGEGRGERGGCERGKRRWEGSSEEVEGRGKEKGGRRRGGKTAARFQFHCFIVKRIILPESSASRAPN
eukprot:554980-Hanusia_phi.AAC.2